MDVVLQMDAKLWGEEYDRHFPPKKVFIVFCEGSVQCVHVSFLV